MYTYGLYNGASYNGVLYNLTKPIALRTIIYIRNEVAYIKIVANTYIFNHFM